MHGYGDPCDDWVMKPCTCGLSALLQPVTSPEGSYQSLAAALKPLHITPPTEAKAVCLDCGLDYGQFGLDVLLPRWQWLEIHPDENGLLCGRCIAVRAARIHGSVAIHATIGVKTPPTCPSCQKTTTVSQLLQYGACCYCSEDAPYEEAGSAEGSSQRSEPLNGQARSANFSPSFHPEVEQAKKAYLNARRVYVQSQDADQMELSKWAHKMDSALNDYILAVYHSSLAAQQEEIARLKKDHYSEQVLLAAMAGEPVAMARGYSVVNLAHLIAERAAKAEKRAEAAEHALAQRTAKP